MKGNFGMRLAMKYNNWISMAFCAIALLQTDRMSAATFGKPIIIGGQAADLALDEGRGVLYVANFTANRIEVMSLETGVIQTSFNVSPQPGALAISPDRKWLLTDRVDQQNIEIMMVDNFR